MRSTVTFARLLGTAALAVALGATPAGAQSPPTRPLGLGDALRATLDKAPVIQTAREGVTANEGLVRFTQGTFDSVVKIGPEYQHLEDDIANTSYYDPERVKRLFYDRLATSFARLSQSLQEQLTNGHGDLPLCPADGGFSVYVATLPGSSLPVPLCRPASLALGVSSETTPENAFMYRRPLTFDPLSSLALQTRLASAFRVQIGTLALDIRERNRELLSTLQTVTNAVSIRSALAVERWGAVPRYTYDNGGSLLGQFSKTFRSGSLFTFNAKLDGRGSFFRDKPLDPTFGGTNVRNSFRSRLEAFLVQPLKRGRGAASVAAAERAAVRNVEASQFTYQQSAADQSLVTAEAYFDLVAARDSLALLQESLNAQRRLLENTIKLVAAGEVASGETARARARAFEVESDVISARMAVVTARQQLATAMGATVAEMASLDPVDQFPARPYDLDVDALAREAVSRRADVHAATSLREASNIFLTAAKAETRSRFDIAASGGFAQVYRGPIFLSLPDEVRSAAHPLDESYVRYYSLTGVGRTFKQKWEPVATITGVIELPFRNNARLGRLAQARAAVSESEIRLADRRRVIETNVPRLVEALRRARAEWQQRQEAVTQYEATWDATQRLRAAGEMSLIDTLLTEQQLTQARLQLVEAKRTYAVAVARLRRETGTLVTFTGWREGQPAVAGMVDARK